MCSWLAIETMLGVTWQPTGCPMWGLLVISTRHVTTWLPKQISYGAALESDMTQDYFGAQQRAQLFGRFFHPRSRTLRSRAVLRRSKFSSQPSPEDMNVWFVQARPAARGPLVSQDTTCSI